LKRSRPAARTSGGVEELGDARERLEAGGTAWPD
jgi:hypothetical protein